MKRVTEPLVVKRLAEQGIDKDYVEFWHDYAPRSKGKEYSPYAKFYRDLKSDKKIMVVSELPMVNADGVKICGDAHGETAVGWELKVGKYHTKPNIFSGAVDGLGVELTAINDQPSGAKKGDSVSWEPQLFLNGVERHPLGGVTLLPTDPTNGSYHHNVLEWDYGICKRRIRVIEGRFRGTWVFPANPNGDVRIKHNFVGNLRVRLGYAYDAKHNRLEIIITDDEELIPASAFADAVYPVEIADSDTFYPEDHPETSSVDGHVQVTTTNEDFFELVQHAGTSSDDNDNYLRLIIRAGSLSDKWDDVYRVIILFDTSALVGVVTAATLSVYGWEKSDGLSATPDLNVYSSAPADNDALVAGDYDSLGTTPFCDTAITYANFKSGTPGDPNDFALNAAGLAAVDVDGVTKLGLRNVNYDVATELDPGNHDPPWVQDATCYTTPWSVDKGTTYRPKLVVTYSPEAPPAVARKPTWMLDPKPRTRMRFYPNLKLR